MRIRIQHESVYRYGTPAKSIIQTVRMTPRSDEGQHVVDWRINVDHDVRLSETQDAFGNIVHVFSVAGNVQSLNVTVEGEVETHDRAGVVRGAMERFPLALYYRRTPLTEADEGLRAFAAATRAGDTLATCHALMAAIHGRVSFDHARDALASDAATAFSTGRGIAQDLTHVFIACARTLGIPARYVSGLVYMPDGDEHPDAPHAWAEAHVEGLGWVGFDPAHDVCPTDRYIRLAAGLDYLGAAPVRGAQLGGDGETLEVRLDVFEKLARRQAARQSQN